MILTKTDVKEAVKDALHELGVILKIDNEEKINKKAAERHGLILKPYPIDKLKVGQSFFVDKKSAVEIGSSIQWYARSTGMKFTTKTQRDKDGIILGTRVWRIL